MSTTPQNLKYTPSHEWVREEEEDIITVGITDHAQSLLGDVVFVEPPNIGKTLQRGEACGVIESVKAAADVYAPLTGEVIAINDTLASQPELINNEPYEAGWLCKIKVKHHGDLSQLLSADAYEASIEA